jgi:hypothetical protein
MAERVKDGIVVGSATNALTRPFLPSIDIVEPKGTVLRELTDADKSLLLATKVADVTHFQVGLRAIGDHVAAAVALAPEVRALPKVVRGRILQPNGHPAERVSVQPATPAHTVLGRGALTDELGVFALPLPELSDETRQAIVTIGLGLVVRGANATAEALVDAPPPDGSALGEIALDEQLEPLPESVVASLIDLVADLPSATPAGAGAEQPRLRVELGQEQCGIVLDEDVVVRRFPYRVLVRLVEPRTTTVSEVFVPGGRFFPGGDNGRGKFLLPIWDADLVKALDVRETAFVDRVPVDKPISVDGFRDQLIGLSGGKIVASRTVPMAGTLGLGYVLNLAQAWRFDRLSLGNLLYSLPLAPGEQQRIAVAESVATASVRETEVLDIAENARAATRQDASTQAVFTSAFEEHVRANSSYENDASSSSWGVAGGIGGVLGGAIGALVGGVGAAGGGGSSSNSGNTKSALDGARQYTSFASQAMHSSVEKESAARRRAQRTAIRLATETETQTVTTKVIANHNKAHALTIQYWEVLRQFEITTDVEGVTLVCFVPLDLVRFLPEGQPLELSSDALTGVDTRSELLERYGLLHRHADAIQPWLPSRHRDGLALLEDFAANPRADVKLDGPAVDVLSIALSGTFLPFERLWVRVLLRGDRSLGPVPLDSSLADIPQKQFGTSAEVLDELRRRRADTDNEATMTGAITLPATVDKSEIVGFELSRSFRTLDYQIDPEKNPTYKLLESLSATFPFGNIFDAQLRELARGVHLMPAELEGLLGGPLVHNFSASIASDPVEGDMIAIRRELPPTPYPIPALEKQHQITYRDLLRMERTLQHVVRNTLTYSRAVWASLTPEERVVMLEGYTIGLPEDGVDVDGLTDPSQQVPLLNCVANQVLGFYGNCMILPFSIPAALATKLAGGEGGPEDDTPPLTTGAVQDALTAFHRQAFSPPVSHVSLPTRGVLGEAVLGHCPSAEKIDLTRFWNWQDSPTDQAPEISPVALTPSGVGALTGPNALGGVAPIINNVATGDATPAGLGALAQALAAGGAAAKDFDTAFLGQDLLKELGAKTIASAESARADALGKATQLASEAMKNATEVFSGVKAKADEDKKKAEEADKAKAAKQEAAVKDLKENAAAYLAATKEKAGADVEKSKTFAQAILDQLAGGSLPPNLAIKLFAAYDQKDGGNRTPAGTAWLTVLGLI